MFAYMISECLGMIGSRWGYEDDASDSFVKGWPQRINN
jgi:hypothetical protein